MGLPIVKKRLKMLRILKIMPMTVYDLSKATGISYNATLKNLQYLEMMNKVERYRLVALDKELWRIKQEVIL